LLNSSAIELSVERDIDLDRELKINGIANILAGISGGTVGFTSVNITEFVVRMGASGRLIGLVCASGSALVLYCGTEAINYIPEPLIGGFLLYIGLEFLTEWVIRPARELPRADLLVIAIILAIVSFVGFLQGIVAGIILAIVLFVIKYSSVDVIRATFSGTAHRSNVDRSTEAKNLIDNHGDMIEVLRLDGFLFFGSTNSLLDRIRERAGTSSKLPLKYLVLDFSAVSGIDSSAVASFFKLGLLATKVDFKIVFTRISATISRQLQSAGLWEKHQQAWKIFDTLEYGIEWCEEDLLRSLDAKVLDRQTKLQDIFEELVPSGFESKKLLKYLDRQEIPDGHVLIQQDDQSDEMYFIESGLVSVFLRLQNGHRFRVRKMYSGTVVGEVGFYLALPRTADVVTERPSVIYSLTRSNLQRMESDEPDLASAFHDFMVRLLARRLMQTNRTLTAGDVR
jgi:sulfate permease, SulP family